MIIYFSPILFFIIFLISETADHIQYLFCFCTMSDYQLHLHSWWKEARVILIHPSLSQFICILWKSYLIGCEIECWTKDDRQKISLSTITRNVAQIRPSELCMDGYSVYLVGYPDILPLQISSIQNPRMRSIDPEMTVGDVSEWKIQLDFDWIEHFPKPKISESSDPPSPANHPCPRPKNEYKFTFLHKIRKWKMNEQ